MIVVIQCAGSKQTSAGTLKSASGRLVKFVAQPDLAPDDGNLYARPDDRCDQGPSWRDLLLRYNREPQSNPLGLLRAFELYTPPFYQALAREVGIDRLYILSAGWGLISAGFLTPDYDITFSAQARGPNAYKRRRKADVYEDICMLAPETKEPVMFFGSKDYLPLFTALTSRIYVPRLVFYRSADEPSIPGCISVRFTTSRRTNWQYDCAEAFLTGKLEIPAV